MRKLIKLLILCIALCFVSRFCQKQTDHFAVAKISYTLLESGPVFSEASKCGLLNQKYHYLTKGGQTYVFVSEDGKYILKLFRSSRLNSLAFLHKIFPADFFQRKIEKLTHHIIQTLHSYQLAKEKLQEETGIIALHLSAEEQGPAKLTIIDKLGIEHTIDPIQYPFIIQKRALLLKEKIDILMEKQELGAAKACFDTLFSFIESRMRLGIEDTDPNLSKNFGFLGEKVVQFDAGNFSLCIKPSFESLAKSKEDLQYWINKAHPKLSKDFDLAYQKMIHSYETR